MADDRMNARERFHATFNYGGPDRVFRKSQGIFHQTHLRWLREGLPADEHYDTVFGFDRMEGIPLKPGYSEDLDAVWPRPRTRVLQRTAEWELVENELGGRYKQWHDRDMGMNQWLRFPVRDPESWETFKQWLNPLQSSRYPQYWDDLVRCYRGRDYPLGITGGSYYGWIRDWVGMENLAFLYYDQPDLVHDMVAYVADFVIRWTERALNDIPDLDFAQVWEDMCMKTGPLISPQLFRQFHLEPMKRVLNVFKQAGVKLIMLDSDGHADELIPLFMEAGMDLLYPLEIAADSDPVRYRAKHGKALRMLGGIDKRALRDGVPKKEIEAQVTSKAALIKEGGYSPAVDHSVPPDVPFEHFRYYMDLLREVCAVG